LASTQPQEQQNVKVSFQPLPVDTTGDGIADCLAVDTTGDGAVDSVRFHSHRATMEVGERRRVRGGG
jgi:hypothetical protein